MQKFCVGDLIVCRVEKNGTRWNSVGTLRQSLGLKFPIKTFIVTKESLYDEYVLVKTHLGYLWVYEKTEYTLIRT